MEELIEAIEYTVAPYRDYSDKYLEQHYPWMLELITAYDKVKDKLIDDVG